MKHRSLTHSVLVMAVAAALISAGCGFNEQRRAYEQAVSAEQLAKPEQFTAVISQYEQVVRMSPGTKWADKAEDHAKALRAKLNSDELHKSVFQEHGVD